MRFSLMVVATLAFASNAAAQNNPLADTLELMERQSWRAWQSHDGKFFEGFLSDDHVEVGSSGTSSKASVVKFVASGVCKVSSYSLDGFKATQLARNTVLLSYHASQDTKCGAAMVPSPVWVSSLFVNHNGRWYCAVYQQTPDATKKPAP
ncbi:MAG: nuclear transport factor 2 family protein [Gemmatimonadaceae bacterium]